MSDRVYIRLGRARRGPFTRDELLRLKSQGQFSRLHEISVDGANWRSSAEFFQSAAANGSHEAAADPRTASRPNGAAAPTSAPVTDRRLVIGVGAFFVCSLCIFLFAAAHKYGWLGRNEPAKTAAAEAGDAAKDGKSDTDDTGVNKPQTIAPPPNAAPVESKTANEHSRRYWEGMSALVNDGKKAASKPTLTDKQKAYSALALKMDVLDVDGVEVEIARYGAKWSGCFQNWAKLFKELESIPGRAGDSLAELLEKGKIVAAKEGKDDMKWADDEIRRDMEQSLGPFAGKILDAARRKSSLDAQEAKLIREGEQLARTYKL